MISSWRRIRAGRRNGKKHNEDENGWKELELTIPNHFRCPISLDLMKDPVTLSTGITYDRVSIERWIEAGNNTCPITNQVLTSLEPIPNHSIRKMIQDWCVENRSFGVERIPTPRIPLSSVEVSEILSKIEKAYREDQDQVGCIELVRKIKAMGKESDRNERCIAANGAVGVLVAAFEAFSKVSFEGNASVLEEILSALTWLLPVDGESKSYLGSLATSLHCLIWFLKSGDLSARRNAVMVLREFLSCNQEKATDLANMKETKEELVKLVKEPICPASTRAALMIIFYMISTADEKIAGEFVDLGLVSLLLEILVDSERSVYEKALGVLDGICGYEKGREKAYEHALTIPVLVKKILRVSGLATEFSVSILWKLSKNENREEDGGDGVLVQALQVGAFQKLLLLLQVGCAERTKEKATELLKMLNLHRERLECIESMDFKDLKRPF